MIESFVDLTYRGLSLGRRIRLSQVRPSSGYLELAAPMPVGTHVAIATEDGVTFDATVSSVHEQVAGSERTPGMVVVPAVVADPASSWWKARVTLPDEDRPPPRPARNRPVTQAPRSSSDPAGPAEGAAPEEIPAALADLTIRVATPAEGEPADASGDPGGPDVREAGEGDAAGGDDEVSETGETSETGDAGGGGEPAPGRGPRKRRKRR